MSSPTFTSLPFSPSKTVSWIHIGDTHMTRSGEQNEIDLGRIVDEINAVYAKGGVDFVFVPGDIADDGGVVAYEAFRQHLDRLQLPWCAIVGDHDVHEKNFHNFYEFIAPELYSSFGIGPYRFLRLNAFSVPRPDSFVVDEKQLQWLKDELIQAEANGHTAVLFLHCYPSELKQGCKELIGLIRHYNVLLVDMGHTHYNEVSNDGKTIYSATRSTGQIEEGPVGYSLTTLDGGSVSWHFVPLGSPSLLSITQPTDERLVTERIGETYKPSQIEVHAKTWSEEKVESVIAEIGDTHAVLQSDDSIFWKGSVDCSKLEEGSHNLKVTATTEKREQLTGSIRMLLGNLPKREFSEIDHENAIGEWTERGLLGTQLGPNKNGKKW